MQGITMNLRLIASAFILLLMSGGALTWEARREERAVRQRIENESNQLLRGFEEERARIASQKQAQELQTWITDSGFKATRVPADDSRLARLLLEKASIEQTRSGHASSDKAPLRLDQRSWEGYPSTVLFSALPTGGFLLLEKTHAPVAGEGSFGFLGKLAVLACGFVGACLLGVSLLMGSKDPDGVQDAAAEENQDQAEREKSRVDRKKRFYKRPHSHSPLETEQSPRLNPSSAAPSEFAQFISKRLEPTEPAFTPRRALRTEQEKEWLREFGIVEKGASKNDPAVLENRLVVATTKATQSPSLFFRFDSEQGIFFMSAQSGLPASFVPEDGGLSFSLSREVMAEARRVDRASNGEPSLKRELSDQAPIMKLLRKRFRMAVFDAWPMFSTTGAWLGILIVSRSQVDASLSPEFFSSVTTHFERGFPSGSRGIFR
jgi:hypothetical protein